MQLQTPRMGRFSLVPIAGGLGAALLVLSWLTTEHFLPWVSWHSEVLAFFAVFILAWTALIHLWRTNREYLIGVPLLSLPFLLVGVVALGQMMAGVMTFWGDVLVVWFYLALCVVCLSMGFCVETTRSESPDVAPQRWTPHAVLALAFVVGSIASVTVAFAQVLDLWPHSAWIVRMQYLRRPGGNLAQPNQLAMLCVMGMASVAFLRVSDILSTPTAALVLLVLCCGLVATESRAGVLALAALLAWWQIKRSAVARQIPPWAAPAVAVVFLVMFSGWSEFLNLLELQSNATNRVDAANGRLVIWPQLLEAILQRPWWGWGVTQVAKAHNAVAHAYLIGEPYSYSHNLMIDWAVWMGVPIALVLSLAAVIWSWRRLKSANQLTSWYCLAVAIPLAVHSMLEFPFAYAYFLAPVLFLLGSLERRVDAKPLLRLRLGPASVMLLVLNAAMVWSVIEYFEIEEDFRVVRFEQMRIGNPPAGHDRPDVVLLTQLGTLLSGSRIELRPGMAPDDLEELKKLALRYPWIATQYRYG
ncbi:MAG: Wzy polymerase domain-containing protein, partial [Ramlibacter sp.]